MEGLLILELVWAYHNYHDSDIVTIAIAITIAIMIHYRNILHYQYYRSALVPLEKQVLFMACIVGEDPGRTLGAHAFTCET